MKSAKKPTSYKAGIFAEALAKIILTLKLYRVIASRYKTKSGEIDIIAVQGKTIIFIEVKKRSNKQELFEAITKHQQQRIAKAAEIFLIRNQTYSAYSKRFDAIFISPKLLPVHIKNAW